MGSIVIGSNSWHAPALSGGIYDQPLMQSSDMTYLGSFRMPTEFDYGCRGMAVDQTNPTKLYAAGWISTAGVGRVTIPSVLDGRTATLDFAPTGPSDPAQNWTGAPRPDLSGGAGNWDWNGGGLIYNGRYLLGRYNQYDGGADATKSHTATTLVSGAPSTWVNMQRIGVNNYYTNGDAAYYSQYMGHVPTAWQSALGGPAFVGGANMSIQNRSCVGPTVFTFNPDDIGSVSPAPANELAVYPGNPGSRYGERWLEPYGPASDYWSQSESIMTVGMASGFRTVFFAQSHGLGADWYGYHTEDSSRWGQPCYLYPGYEGEPTWHLFGYDPVQSDKGPHSYPYVFQIMAFDALDFVAVRAGTKNPWEPFPYARWRLTEMGNGTGDLTDPAMGTYDPATRRLFIAASKTHPPLVHVYQIRDPG